MTPVIFLVLAALPSQPDAQTTPDANPQANLVVLENFDASWLAPWGEPPFWRPSPSQLAQVEAQIPEFFREQLAKHPSFDRAPEPRDYVFQVIGLNREGTKVLFLNAYCGRPPTPDLVLVLDGGPCYFAVLYDLETRSFSMLVVNGEA